MLNKYEKEIILDRLRFTSSKAFTGHTLAKLNMDMVENDIINCLVFHLRTEIMAEKIEDRKQIVIFEAPKSWWQHFKQECFPKWLLGKFPVKLKSYVRSVTFKHYATYPELPLVFPKDKIGRVIYKDFITVKEE